MLGGRAIAKEYSPTPSPLRGATSPPTLLGDRKEPGSTAWLPSSPSRSVQTGDKVDRCSETSWTLSTANQGGCRMPFREVSRMDERLEFVMLASVNGANVRGLCRRFGMSPTTGYKWLERWRLDGLAGLDELSRRPLSSPLRSDAVTEA